MTENNLQECPFCDSIEVEYFNGWKWGDRTRDNSPFRTPTITCNLCGIGFTVGVIGRGIPDYKAQKILERAWNKRAYK
jgi:hypothetical protein